MPVNVLDRSAPTEAQINAVVEIVAVDMERQFDKKFLKPLHIRKTIHDLVLRALQWPLQDIGRVSGSVAASMKKVLASIQVEQNRNRENISAHDSDTDLVPFDDRPSKKPFSIVHMTPGRLDKPTSEEALAMEKRRKERVFR